MNRGFYIPKRMRTFRSTNMSLCIRGGGNCSRRPSIVWKAATAMAFYVVRLLEQSFTVTVSDSAVSCSSNAVHDRSR